MGNFFDKYIQAVKDTDTIKYTGAVTAVKGLMIESNGPRCVIGEICRIEVLSENTSVLAEVVGLEGNTVRLMVFGETKGIEAGAQVTASGNVLEVPVSEKLLGRVVDATGTPIDGKGDIASDAYYPALAPAPNPLERKPI
ncbi:MAG: flagellum-specific ATP synthase FliI, partial [Treponema sp.]|nr:flagellum-specific ATP synthase FliI [Treponema sp.]